LPHYTSRDAQALHAETLSHTGRASRLSQIHGKDSPEVLQERRNAAAARLAAHVAETVAVWPDLTPDQLRRIATMLASGKQEAGES
jgi:hypothetical protein